MIRYDLKCDQGHDFDSWFASAAAYDRLATSGHVTCPDCGSGKVSKALMAPSVSTARRKVAAPAEQPTPLSQPRNEREERLAELRARVEAETVDVGNRFATEARAMHDGTAPARAIRGEASIQDAKALIEDGIPVLPLPFMPGRKNN